MERHDIVNVLFLPLFPDPWIYPEVDVDPGIAKITGQKRSFLCFSTKALLIRTREHSDLDISTDARMIFSEYSAEELVGTLYELIFAGYKVSIPHDSVPPLA